MTSHYTTYMVNYNRCSGSYYVILTVIEIEKKHTQGNTLKINLSSANT